MKSAFVIFLIAMLYGCATATTLSNSDDDLARQLKKHDTYCESLPRTYSGVAYNLCKLNSKPNNTEVDLLVGFYLFDGAISLVTDTLVLPYTIYQQSEQGSLEIEP